MWPSHLVRMVEGRLPKNSMKPDDVARSLGVDGGGPTTKGSRGDETARSWERGRPHN